MRRIIQSQYVKETKSYCIDSGEGDKVTEYLNEGNTYKKWLVP